LWQQERKELRSGQHAYYGDGARDAQDYLANRFGTRGKPIPPKALADQNDVGRQSPQFIAPRPSSQDWGNV
jgi:hypothetical protein